MCPGAYDNSVSDLLQHTGVTQMKAWHSLMSRLNITTSMIHQTVEFCEGHTKWLRETWDALLSDAQ